jgi:hypothetical protein
MYITCSLLSSENLLYRARIRCALSTAQWLDDVEPVELLMRRFARPLCLICSPPLSLTCVFPLLLSVGGCAQCTRRCLNVLLIECRVECKEPGNFCNWQFAWHRVHQSAFDNWPAVIYSLFELSYKKPSLLYPNLSGKNL